MDSNDLEQNREKLLQPLTPTVPPPKSHRQKKITVKVIKEQPELLEKTALSEQAVKDKTSKENLPSEPAEKIEDILELAPSAEKDDLYSTPPKDKKKVLEIFQKWKKQLTSEQAVVVKNSEEIVSKRREFIHNVIAKKNDIISQRRLAAKWKSPVMSKAMLRFYLAQVNRAILPFWEIPLELDPSLRVRVRIKVGRKGEIESFEVVQPSGNKLLDQAVQKVFKQVKLFPPLPNWYKGIFLEFGLNFSPATVTGN